MLKIQKIQKIILDYIANFLIWFKENRRKNAEWNQWQVDDYFEHKALKKRAK